MLAYSEDFLKRDVLADAAEQRRVTPRMMVNWRARVLVAPPKFVDATVIDLSEGGMGLHCDHRVRHNQVYEFAVAVPTVAEWDRHQVIQARAVVKSAVLAGQRFRLGVQFVTIGPAAQGLIRAWIKNSANNAFAGVMP
jgi:c-di-GMP-binding flagellar brake protein YcgR